MAKSTEAPTESDGVREDARHGERRLARVVHSVMAALGRPGDFLRATAIGVSANSFRVNVVTGPNASAARVAHSFFVTADETGNVTHSSPALVKLY